MLPEADVSKSMNFKDTELTLGLPGGGGGGGGHCSSSSADRDHVFSFGGFKSTSSMKRGFMEMVDHLDLDSSTSCAPRGQVKMDGKLEANKMYSSSSSSSSSTSTTTTTLIKAPAAKSRVVGWPPVRSLRQKAVAESSKYVKVGPDGAPYLRKLDLVMYQSYQDLLAALKKMFTSFTICGKFMEDSNEAMMKPAVKGIVEYYVLTYEDKDGDWMLVGDVPWKMFIESCKRIRLMKSSEAVGIYSAKDSPTTRHEY